MSELLDEETLREFRDEVREHILVLNRDLLEMEERGAEAPADLVNNAFRAIHSVKGLSGMLGLLEINQLSHCMEDVLAWVRQGDVVVVGELAEALFESLDLLSSMIEDTARAAVGRTDIGPVLTRLEAAGEEARSSSGTGIVRAAPPPGGASREPIPTGAAGGEGDGGRIGPSGEGDDGSRANDGARGSQAIRVRVEKLDRILALVGELVISRSRYNHLAGKAISDLAEAETVSRKVIGLQTELNEVESVMSRTLTELQDAVMKARLVPLGSVFGKFRRAVRDLASQTGRRVRFQSCGGGTELDKKVIDQIGDPLMHLVRNAVDHGIEPPEERRSRGKPEEGSITLSATQEGDRVVIVVQDDGRGLDRGRIVEKAIERGLLSPERGAEVGDREIQEIVISPGFSTARKVTGVSGRGVGLDVVQETLANLKGTLDIGSAPGAGTTFRIELPLTMAIVDSLLVAVGDERYAIAVSSVREILEVGEGEIHEVGESECFRANERVVPLIRLHSALGADGGVPAPRIGGKRIAVVVDSDEGNVGLVVDRVIGQQEIVIKALSRRFENVLEVSGGSVLGDGSVCLILDVRALVAKAKGAVPDLVGAEA